MKTTKQLPARRLVLIPRSDLPLARAAGGAIQEVKIRHSTRYFVSKIIASAILVAKRAAGRTGRQAIDVLRALNEAKAVGGAALMETEREMYTLDRVNSVLAEILGAPVVMGPIRANPDGTFDIRYSSSWVPASDELLHTWDAERRLGVVRGMHHSAAELILRWKNGGV